jgi:hypothetical protein
MLISHNGEPVKGIVKFFQTQGVETILICFLSKLFLLLLGKGNSWNNQKAQNKKPIISAPEKA